MNSKEEDAFAKQLIPYLGRMASFGERHIDKLQETVDMLSFLLSPMTHHVSREPLQNLKRVSLIDLVDYSPKIGCYVVLRILTVPMLSQGVLKSIVEDHIGNVVILHLVNFAEVDYFPLGSIFILKEPVLSTDRQYSVHSVICRSPSDIIPIHKAPKLQKMVNSIVWKTKLSYSGTCPKSALALKEQGDRYFDQKCFTKALNYYLWSLNAAAKERDEQLIIVIALNLSAVCLETGDFEYAVSYAQKVPNNKKAHYRAGRAYYELREFEKSAAEFTELLRIEPGNEHGSEWLQKCSARLDEMKAFTAKGVEKLRLLSDANPGTCLDCADFLGPVRVDLSSSSNARIVATDDILPGTVLVVSKALSAVFCDPVTKINNKQFCEMIFELKSGSTSLGNVFETCYRVQQDTVFRGVVTAVSQILMKNPKTFGTSVNELCRACFGNKSIQSYGGETEEEVELDKGSVIDLLKSKHFVLQSFVEKGMGFFIFPSYFKNSCVPNALFKTYNNVMVIQSVAYIRKGQEVQLYRHGEHGCTYSNPPVSECTCVLCTLDREEPVSIRKERADLTEQFESMTDDTPYVQSKLEDLVKRLKATYKKSGRTRYQVDLIHPYMMLSARGRDKGFGYMLRIADKALAIFGLDRYTLLKCVEENPDFPIFPDHVLVISWIVGMVELYTKLYKNKNEINVSRWGMCYSSLAKLFLL